MRILGIDIGSKVIKAVELDSRFGRFEIHDYHERTVEVGQDPHAVLAEMMHSLPRQPDRMAIALPGGEFTFRTLDVPTKNKKAIQSAVPFEIEDDLPFDLSDAVYDYSILKTTKTGSNIHASIALRKTLRAMIDSLETTGVDPDVLTTEAWAYRTMFQRMGQRIPQQEPILLVHIGHAHTTLYAQVNGTPLLFKEISWGGRDLTQTIAQQYGLSEEQAEKAKIDQAFVLTEAHKTQAGIEADQIKLSEALHETLRPLIMDIRQTVLACKRISHQSVAQIYLTGATALMPGLRLGIEEQLRIPTENLRALTLLSTPGVKYSEAADASFLLATSIALCLTERSGTINLRKGDLLKESRTQNISLEQFKQPAQALGIVLTVLMVSLAIQNQVYSGRMEEVDARLEKSLKTFFGYISKSALKTYLSDPKKLREAIQKELQSERELASLLKDNPASPVDFIKSLSQKVPKSMVADLIHTQVGSAVDAPYQVDAKREVTLTFLMGRVEDIPSLQLQLERLMTGLQKTEPEKVAATVGEGPRWKVQFTGKPNEESYGKN